MGLNGFRVMKMFRNENIEENWEPLRICLLNSTANQAQFG